MKLKALFTTILVACSITFSNAQSKELLAKSAMMNADEAYSNGQYVESLKFLKDAETNLGETNSRIQYLRVKIWMVLATDEEFQQPKQSWLYAEEELKLFFKVTPENGYVPEKYDEMVLALGKVKKNIAEADEVRLAKCDAAIEKDPTDWGAYLGRANAKADMKDYQGAIQDYSKFIEGYPEAANIYGFQAAANIYGFRAAARQKTKDYQGAIQDYSKIIELDPNDASAFFDRGKTYQNKLNNIQAAKKDFEKVILMNADASLIAFANYYLGEKEKAFNFLDKTLKDAGDNIEVQQIAYYLLARLYLIDDNQAEALKSLKNAFEKGFKYFDKIEEEEDFDNIRNSPEFKELINKYKNK